MKTIQKNKMVQKVFEATLTGVGLGIGALIVQEGPGYAKAGGEKVGDAFRNFFAKSEEDKKALPKGKKKAA
jgi:hypothetical protein